MKCPICSAPVRIDRMCKHLFKHSTRSGSVRRCPLCSGHFSVPSRCSSRNRHKLYEDCHIRDVGGLERHIADYYINLLGATKENDR